MSVNGAVERILAEGLIAIIRLPAQAIGYPQRRLSGRTGSPLPSSP